MMIMEFPNATLEIEQVNSLPARNACGPVMRMFIFAEECNEHSYLTKYSTDFNKFGTDRFLSVLSTPLCY